MKTLKNFSQKYGPWALITGASSGIGEQFAHMIAQEGINVILIARRMSLLEKLAENLRQLYGVEAEAQSVDLAQDNFIEPILRCGHGKDVGLIVINAAAGAKGPHHEISSEKLSSILNINCRVAMMLTHAFIPELIQRGRGGILLTGSIEGFFGFPWSSGYAASKAFILSLGEGLGQELKGYNIDVLVLSPGATDTEFPISQGVRREELMGIMSPHEVARHGLKQLGRKPIYITGWINRLYIGIFSMLPRSLAVKLSGMGMLRALKRSS